MSVQLRGITWDDPRGWGPMREVTSAFTRLSGNHGIDVVWDVQPLAGFESRPLADLAVAYDLINMDHPHLGEAVESGLLVPIAAVDDQYVGPSYSSYVWHEQLWAVPIDAACQCAAYHPDRLAQPAQCYEHVADLKQHGLRVVASLHGVHALMALLTLMAQLGCPVGDEPPGQTALEPAADLLRRMTYLCAVESLKLDPIRLLGGMARGAYDYAVFTFAYAPFQRDGVRFAPVPSADDGPSRGATLGGTGLAVSRHSAWPEHAAALARFIGSRDVQTGLWPEHRGQPAHRDAWDQLSLRDPFYRDLRPAIESAYTRPRFAGWNRVQSLAGTAVNQWLADPRASTKQLHDQLVRLWTDARKEPA